MEQFSFLNINEIFHVCLLSKENNRPLIGISSICNKYLEYYGTGKHIDVHIQHIHLRPHNSLKDLGQNLKKKSK